MSIHAYFAGLIDGEGTISLDKVDARRPNSRNPTVKVNMTCEAVIRALHAEYGGYLGFRPRAKEHYKDQWIWRVKAQMARKCLEQILPYLIVKKPEAEAVLAHMEASRKRRGIEDAYPPPVSVTPECRQPRPTRPD